MLAFGVILACACSPTTQAQSTQTMSPVDVVKAYEDAFNRHDIPATLALFTEDVDLWNHKLK